ncbi:hypothetical protein ACFLQG_01455 [Candidatus Zixiibacteriota bacterium]
MRKISICSLLIVLTTSVSAKAANFAVITNPPTILSLFVLFAAVGCLMGALKLLDLLKGGQLFKSWQIFLFGFVALAISQAAILLHDFEIFVIPNFVVPALLLVTLGLFLFGVFTTKKVLS